MRPKKLSDEDVKLVRELYQPLPQKRLSMREIAQKFGVSETTIWNAVNGYSYFRLKRSKPP